MTCLRFFASPALHLNFTFIKDRISLFIFSRKDYTILILKKTTISERNDGAAKQCLHRGAVKMGYFSYSPEAVPGYLKSQTAAFRPAAVFSDHAVFQRDKSIKIFGECLPGSFITATLMKGSHQVSTASCFSCPQSSPASVDRTVRGNADTFLLELPPENAGRGYSLALSCREADNTVIEKNYTDIAIGEVFLAGGQSNMEYELRNCYTGPASLKNDRPDVRFYYTQKYAVWGDEYFDHEDNSGWSTFSEETAGCWSAVGYYFAKELSEKLHIPVGIIGCNWGGTSASAWTDIHMLEKDSELNTYIEDYENYIDGRDLASQAEIWKKYTDYAAEWQKRIDAYYKETPGAEWSEALKVCGECEYPGPLVSFNQFRPGGLYETMLKRVAPYTLKGFLYYQGESDDHKPEYYYKLFCTEINCWRQLFHDDTLPFLFVQLPMHRYTGDPDKKNWCVIRAAQKKAYDTVKNTGMAVALDCGAYNEIHPKEKTVVAHRLFLAAMDVIYGEMSENNISPLIKSAIVEAEGIIDTNHLGLDINFGLGFGWESESARVRLSFHNVKNGLIKRVAVPDTDPADPEHAEKAVFELSSDGITYFPADFYIDKKDIVLTSDSLTHPRFVRYAWTNYASPVVFEKNGLPLAPFTLEI